MLLYCIIMWLMGLGVFTQIYRIEKEAKLFKSSDLIGYTIVWIAMPLVLPIIVGWKLTEDYEAK